MLGASRRPTCQHQPTESRASSPRPTSAAATRMQRDPVDPRDGSDVGHAQRGAAWRRGPLPVPVRLVDSGTAGFGVSCCVWAAAEAIASGATLDEAVHVAESLTPRIGTVFVVGQLDFIRTRRLDRSRRRSGDDRQRRPGRGRRPGRHGGRRGRRDGRHRTRVGHPAERGGRHGRQAGEQLTDVAGRACSASQPNVAEVVRYRIGPSVGAYTGPRDRRLLHVPSTDGIARRGHAPPSRAASSGSCRGGARRPADRRRRCRRDRGPRRRRASCPSTRRRPLIACTNAIIASSSTGPGDCERSVDRGDPRQPRGDELLAHQPLVLGVCLRVVGEVVRRREDPDQPRVAGLAHQQLTELGQQAGDQLLARRRRC